MTPREASAELERMIKGVRSVGAYWEPRTEIALMMARQAIAFLATLEERLPVGESITITNHGYEWVATRGSRTHRGSDIGDVLGQLCQTLALE